MSSKTPKARQDRRIDSRPWNIATLVSVLGCTECKSKVYVNRKRQTVDVHHEVHCVRVPKRHRKKQPSKSGRRFTVSTPLSVEVRGR